MPGRRTGVSRLFLRLVAAAALAAIARPVQSAQPRGDRLVLITLDGARVEEMFGGLDADVFRSTLPKDVAAETHPVYRRFWASSPEERRRRLMPFFWDEWMARHGSIAGNPRLSSVVRLTNTHRFSYPGYSELLVGAADDTRIASNDRVRNPHTTVLEGLRAHGNFTADEVAVFASWEVFNEIVEHVPGALTVNAGYEASGSASPAAREMSRLQFETLTPWNSVRHDAHTFGLAMTHLAEANPRVLYLAFGETDDWAHDGRYDRMLDAYARTDAYLRALWDRLESDADYRDRTHILVTTDHGRGRTTADWRNHGATVAGAEDIWMAFISPAVAARGEWRGHPPIFASQAAATMAAWMGLDWTAVHAGAGRPIAFPLR